MYKFNHITQNSQPLLTLTLKPTDQMDSLALGMMGNNQIKGLLPMSKCWENQGFVLMYQVSSLTPLTQYIPQLSSEARLTTFLKGVCDAISECREYLMDPEKLLLEAEYVYVRASTGEPGFVYLPLKDAKGSVKPQEFLKDVIRKVVKSLPSESKLRQILLEYTIEETFDLGDFRENLETLKGSTELKNAAILNSGLSGYSTSANPQEQSRQAPRPGSDSNPSPAPASNSKASLGMPEQPGFPANSGGAVPFGGGQQEENENKSGKKGLFGGKKEKSEKKEKIEKKEKEKKEKDKKGRGGNAFGVETPFRDSTPDFGVDNPFAPSVAAVASPYMQGGHEMAPEKKEEPARGSAPQESYYAAEAQAAQHPTAEKPSYGGASAEVGHTVMFQASGDGATQILSMGESSGGNDSTPGFPVMWLLRRGTNERVLISHNNFHIGRKISGDDIVDYAVLTQNAFLGADHAYFTVKGNQFYVVDNNSKNKTRVNGRELNPSTPTPVSSGDTVQFADIIFDLRDN